MDNDNNGVQHEVLVVEQVAQQRAAGLDSSNMEECHDGARQGAVDEEDPKPAARESVVADDDTSMLEGADGDGDDEEDSDRYDSDEFYSRSISGDSDDDSEMFSSDDDSHVYMRGAAIGGRLGLVRKRSSFDDAETLSTGKPPSKRSHSTRDEREREDMIHHLAFAKRVRMSPGQQERLSLRKVRRARSIIFRHQFYDKQELEQLCQNTALRISSFLHVMDRGPQSANPTEKPPPPTFLHFQSLPPWAQTAVLQFLPVPTLVAMRQVDRSCRRLLQSDDNEEWQAICSAIWNPACVRQWPWLEHKDWPVDEQQQDYARLVASCLTCSPPGNENPTMSTAVDEDRFPPEIEFTDNTKSSVRYIGTVGPNNLCLCGNGPLPGSSRLIEVRPRHAGYTGSISEWQAVVEQWEPFVAPFALTDTCFNLEPRMVSYYEVNILHPPPPSSSEAERNHGDDCIAVGLGLKDFPSNTHMPGWKWSSYGYHSDDGDCYYNGRPRHSLSSFGAGDCVGCGINYVEKCVFFCKNGEHVLSVAVSDADLSRKHYPYIGLDSRFPVKVNFGETPFQFDLLAVVRAQRDHVATGLGR